MTEPSLPDKIELLDHALTNAAIAHAFGGALALAYYADPRATIDIDLNVFVPVDHHDDVIVAIAPLGVATKVDASLIERDGQVRVWWGRTPIDLFYSYTAVHDAMRDATRTVPFGPILAPPAGSRSSRTNDRSGLITVSPRNSISIVAFVWPSANTTRVSGKR